MEEMILSKLSFKVFCIENYAEHKKMNSADVFNLFEKAGIIKFIDRDYEDLHGMSFEYMMYLFDENLEVNK